MTKFKDLNLKQRQLIEAYHLNPSSITALAKTIGYSSDRAHDIIKSEKGQRYLKELQEVRKFRLGVTEDRILQELCSIAFSNLKDLIKEDENGNTVIDLKNITREQAAAISEISKRGLSSKIKLSDKLNALIHVGKHIGMFRDQVEVKGKLTLEQLVLESMEDSVKKEKEVSQESIH